MHPLFDLMVNEIRTDIGQMVEEGHDERALLAELEKARAGGSLQALADLQEDLWGRPSPPSFPYQEPGDWAGISACFPDPQTHAALGGTDRELADRLRAAWLGRCAGCQLGKALEGAWPEEVKEVLTAIGSWPLVDYLNPVSQRQYQSLAARSPAFKRHYRHALARGGFDCVAPDDDIHYTIVGQTIIEQHGTGFTSAQAIAKLVELSAASCVFAAGRNMLRTALFGIASPATAVFGNPCRQSLGAQIRCDPWGWNAPGDPPLAARMAFADGSGSQTRNGIYSGIFFAVLLSDVLAGGDVARAIDTGAGYVPPKSRFAEMVRFVKDRCAAHDDWEAVNAAIYQRYDRGNPRAATVKTNHSLPNAAIVLMSLLKGQGDFSRTISIAVMAGMDTDCNGATAGSIMGCALGTGGVPVHWTAPFNDTIRTELKGSPQVRISELARRTFQTARKSCRRPAGEGR